jgi:hypothetical protein
MAMGFSVARSVEGLDHAVFFYLSFGVWFLLLL